MNTYPKKAFFRRNMQETGAETEKHGRMVVMSSAKECFCRTWLFVHKKIRTALTVLIKSPCLSYCYQCTNMVPFYRYLPNIDK